MSEGEYWAQLIREIRNKGGLTIAQIAQRIGVHERQVSNWLAGDRPKGLHALNIYLLHGRLGRSDSAAQHSSTNTTG